MLTLVKKDYLLIKKYTPVLLLGAILLPLFVSLRLPPFKGLPSFLMTVFLLMIILCQSVSVEEAKYPKAIALICSTPFSRSSFVVAKYVFALSIFGYCAFANAMMALIIPDVVEFNWLTGLFTLAFISIIYGVYMPLETKFGVMKTKMILMLLLLLVFFGLPGLYGAGITLDTAAIPSIPSAVLYAGLGLMSVVLFVASAVVSIRIFANKEL